jgi:hypothetical protein
MQNGDMKRAMKTVAYIGASAVGFVVLAVAGLWLWWKASYYLPPAARVSQEFIRHRAEYTEFVGLLANDPSARFVDQDGRVGWGGTRQRIVREYGHLMQETGVKFVIVGDDGSVEFALLGNGCAICSDSYMGVLYDPASARASDAAWDRIVVTSLDSARLPQENGSVATGLYVVEIEPHWFVYRFGYQE